MSKQKLLKQFEEVIRSRFAWPEKVLAKFNNKAFREGFEAAKENCHLNENPYYNSSIGPRKPQGKRYQQYLQGCQLGRKLKASFR